MRGIDYLLLRFGLGLFFAFITLPVIVPLILCMQYLETQEHLKMLRLAFLPFLLAWLFGLPWLANQTAQHMAFDDKKFSAAVKMTGYDLRLLLTFLPWIGHWFAISNDQDDITGDN
jgi:hypothetical protein